MILRQWYSQDKLHYVNIKLILTSLLADNYHVNNYVDNFVLKSEIKTSYLSGRSLHKMNSQI